MKLNQILLVFFLIFLCFDVVFSLAYSPTSFGVANREFNLLGVMSSCPGIDTNANMALKISNPDGICYHDSSVTNFIDGADGNYLAIDLNIEYPPRISKIETVKLIIYFDTMGPVFQKKTANLIMKHRDYIIAKTFSLNDNSPLIYDISNERIWERKDFENARYFIGVNNAENLKVDYIKLIVEGDICFEEVYNGIDDDCDTRIDDLAGGWLRNPVTCESWESCGLNPKFYCGEGTKLCEGIPQPECQVGAASICNQYQYCEEQSCFHCTSGKRNCNLNLIDGCETNVLFDERNCGDCGIVCFEGETCVNGECSTGYAVDFCDKQKCGPHSTCLNESEKCICEQGYSNCDGDTANGCEVLGWCNNPYTLPLVEEPVAPTGPQFIPKDIVETVEEVKENDFLTPLILAVITIAFLFSISSLLGQEIIGNN